MKLKLLLFAMLFITAKVMLSAQTGRPAPEFDTYHKNIYVEGLGSSLLIGVNFDMRLQKGRMDGIGFRVGVGGARGDYVEQNSKISGAVVTFPLEFNYLRGKRRSSFETGVGLLPAYLSASAYLIDNPTYYNGEGLSLIGGYVTLGYRFQPLKAGPMFRVVWNPMVLRKSGFHAGWIGVGLGVGFK